MPPSTSLNFGQALEALKSGSHVSRIGWNGKGMFVLLNKGSSAAEVISQGDGATIDGIPSKLFAIGEAGPTTRYPNINMRAATGATVIGWTPSQTDIFAEDCCILE